MTRSQTSVIQSSPLTSGRMCWALAGGLLEVFAGRSGKDIANVMTTQLTPISPSYVRESNGSGSPALPVAGTEFRSSTGSILLRYTAGSQVVPMRPSLLSLPCHCARFAGGVVSGMRIETRIDVLLTQATTESLGNGFTAIWYSRRCPLGDYMNLTSLLTSCIPGGSARTSARFGNETSTADNACSVYLNPKP
jgi:hypothetical protein